MAMVDVAHNAVEPQSSTVSTASMLERLMSGVRPRGPRATAGALGQRVATSNTHGSPSSEGLLGWPARPAADTHDPGWLHSCG
jgi:hypothetical protein